MSWSIGRSEMPAMTGHPSRASTAKTTSYRLRSASPSEQTVPRRSAAPGPLLAASRRITPDGDLRGGVRHGDSHRGRGPGMGEDYPDCPGAVFAGVLDRVGDQFGRDGLGGCATASSSKEARSIKKPWPSC